MIMNLTNVRGATMIKCKQCSVAITESLAATITDQQLKVAKDPQNKRLICISCFCQNGMAFECPEHLREKPIPESVVIQQNIEKEEARKQRRIERKKGTIQVKTQTPGRIPRGDNRTVARWDLSKNGRLGRPKSAKIDGANTYACPICSIAVRRVHNFPGRTLDDVVEHMLEEGCYDKFLAEEER